MAIAWKMRSEDTEIRESLKQTQGYLDAAIDFIGIGLSIICLLFLDPILRFFGASDQTLIYAHEYMVIILLGNVVSHMYFGMNALLRAASKPKQAMYLILMLLVYFPLCPFIAS